MMHPWFPKAKLGIFIHWGIYTVNGKGESWPIADAKISSNDYYAQRHDFTVTDYNPTEWAKYIKATGARYTVLTTKHHDGFCLFDTKYTDFNTVKSAPCKRDLIEPFAKAIRDAGIKLGLYFTNTDWADDDHLRVLFNKSQAEIDDLRANKVNFFNLWGINYPYTPEEKIELDACWNRFMTRYKGEITELLTKYQPDVLWTDVMISREGFSWETKEVKEMIERISPNTICNGRLPGYGDYETPERYIPLLPLDGPWELCETFNNSWAYSPDDMNYKSIKQLVRTLCECISKGGNLLLNITPDKEGRIPEKTKENMLKFGAWVNKYSEAIFDTEKGIDTAYYLGGSTLSEDKKTLYLFQYDLDCEKIMLNGLYDKPKKVTALKNNMELEFKVEGGADWINMPGCLWIDVPLETKDEVCSVFKLEFEEPIRLLPMNLRVQSLGES